MCRGSSTAAGRVLVVLGDCGAGDALKVSWLVRALREALPGAVLTMLVSEPAEPVYRGSGLADRLVVSRLYRRRSGSRLRLRLAKAGELLRLAAAVGRGYDLVLTLWWGSTALHLLGRWAGRGRRIAYSCRLPRLLTSHLGPYDFRGDDVEQN